MTILRTRNFSTVRDLVCMLTDIYLLKKLSIRRAFFFDDTVGLRAEHESRPKCLATGEIDPSSSLVAFFYMIICNASTCP